MLKRNHLQKYHLAAVAREVQQLIQAVVYSPSNNDMRTDQADDRGNEKSTIRLISKAIISIQQNAHFQLRTEAQTAGYRKSLR